MKLETLIRGVFLFLIVAIFSCGDNEGGTRVGNPDTTESVGAAVSGLLGSSAESSESANLEHILQFFISNVHAQEQGSFPATCDSVTETPSGGIAVSADITPGTYGTSANSVIVVESDACANGGDYAGFVVSTQSMSCEDSSGGTLDIEFSASHGVYQNDLINYIKNIYGEFNFITDSTLTTVNCHLQISYDTDDRETDFEGSCEDSSGNVIAQDTDLVCTLL